MDFKHSDKVIDLQERLTAFMQDHVIPAEQVAEEYLREHPDHWGQPPVMRNLRDEARRQDLWNLFLPQDPRGGGLTNLEYAPLAELTGWSPQLAPEALNCSAPDTGNMEMLSRYGTDEQHRRWLAPLLAGEFRSAFSMTEPAVASSDANNVELEIRADGDAWVLNGRKWWSSGAMRPDCRVTFVMGVTDPEAPVGRRHSIVAVPLDAPGLTRVRSTHVLGYDDRHEGGHAVIDFQDVRVPQDHLLGPRGGGFAVAQGRLGPGRIHHCMRLIGMGERALAHLVNRANSRVAFGQPLADQGVVQAHVADARVAIDAARLLVLKAAWRMDREGAKAARHDIAKAKILVPGAIKKVIDDAIQVHGGAGLSQDVPLPMLYAQARFLQIADGPDEVHRRSLARHELASSPTIKVA
ncbi:MAG: acyl-CoA dehydrogenase family protein [Nocardioides sp.]|uniref:acyl-CoA dehydrogenase family protein n=1 Tax=Nocardioides sp. TaxID=35761 RepID=UPI0039E71C21